MEINLEQKQKNGLLYCLKTFENYNLTIFAEIAEYCDMKAHIKKGFITTKDLTVLSKINISLDVGNEFIMWKESADAGLKFKEIFHELEEKFFGEMEAINGKSRFK